ncbi:hypothetical protein M9H77_30171 [Catharanthus roseus]|uniref:Uncharacterized protein n=1 Tax=Catharanthus roseus TaxID=4058 RepID=A0ACB9ZXB4_CATRO|nr:hypothetical protein M9H77_30171 [Catharanthus roseus]
MKTSFRPGLKFVENQVNGRVSGLHCTWLVPRTRASSNDVDGFLTLRVDPLEDGRSTLRAWPNRYLRGHRIMLCGRTISSERSGAQQATECREARRCPTQPQLAYNIQKLQLLPVCNMKFSSNKAGKNRLDKNYLNVLMVRCEGAALYASPSTGIHATNSSTSVRDASPFYVLKTVQN